MLTHEDLEVIVSLSGLATDAEGDPVFYRVANAENGGVTLGPDGTSSIFTPDTTYTGPAAFEIIADDGFWASDPILITVNVSDAPLEYLDFAVRNPKLDLGEAFVLQLVADFADQENVVVPASYVTFDSSDVTVATLNANGSVNALNVGHSVATASSHGIGAATAIAVGFPEEDTAQLLLLLRTGDRSEFAGASPATAMSGNSWCDYLIAAI